MLHYKTLGTDVCHMANAFSKVAIFIVFIVIISYYIKMMQKNYIVYYYHVGPTVEFVCQPVGAGTLGKGRQKVCLAPSE